MARAIAREIAFDRMLTEVIPNDTAHDVQKPQLEGRPWTWLATTSTIHRGLRKRCWFVIGTGTNIAIETSEVTLIEGSLMGVVIAIETNWATLRNVHQHLVGAFSYNSLGISVAIRTLSPGAATGKNQHRKVCHSQKRLLCFNKRFGRK